MEGVPAAEHQSLAGGGVVAMQTRYLGWIRHLYNNAAGNFI